MEDFGNSGKEKPMEKPLKTHQDSIGTPVDMTPDPNFQPLHQGEELDAKALLGMLRRPQNPDDEAKDSPLGHIEDSESF